MGLLGPNGVGKATLIHLILGLHQADEGEILIDGKTYDEDEQEIRDITGIVLLEDLDRIADYICYLEKGNLFFHFKKLAVFGFLIPFGVNGISCLYIK